MKVEILSGVVAKDHVHLLVSYPPQVCVSKLVQKLKGKSSYKLQREFASLGKEYLQWLSKPPASAGGGLTVFLPTIFAMIVTLLKNKSSD